MAPRVIDLTGSDSDESILEESPRKSVLEGFKPRKEKQKQGLYATHDSEESHVTAAKNTGTSKRRAEPHGSRELLDHDETIVSPAKSLWNSLKGIFSSPDTSNNDGPNRSPPSTSVTHADVRARPSSLGSHGKQRLGGPLSRTAHHKEALSSNGPGALTNGASKEARSNNHSQSPGVRAATVKENVALSKMQETAQVVDKSVSHSNGYAAPRRLSKGIGSPSGAATGEPSATSSLKRLRQELEGGESSQPQKRLRASDRIPTALGSSRDRGRGEYGMLPHKTGPGTSVTGKLLRQEPQQPEPGLRIQEGPIHTDTQNAPGPTKSTTHNMHGQPFTSDEIELLKRLRGIENRPWEEVLPYFNGRSLGALQVKYSTKVSKMLHVGKQSLQKENKSRPSLSTGQSSTKLDDFPVRAKRARKSAPAAVDGFVSWASLKNPSKNAQPQDYAEEHTHAVASSRRDEEQPRLLCQDQVFPSSMAQILRHRELGVTSRRAWTGAPSVTDELQNHVFSGYGLRKQYEKMSGDVISLAWSSGGNRFAASAVAISDHRSMQYNMSRNLLLGDAQRNQLRELTEHHVPRPMIDKQDSSNVNALHAMRESQDPRLFLTVTATGFSANGERLFTTGTDRKLRQYDLTVDGVETVTCRDSFDHDSSVDLLAVHGHQNDLLAVGCHSASKSIRIYRSKTRLSELHALSPSRNNALSSVPIFPSALKWGTAPQHRHLLLAGFSGDEDKQNAGETLLYDAASHSPIPLPGSTRNVFDVAWNPAASSSSIAFVVASDPSSEPVSKGMRSVVQCFAPDSGRARRVLTWQCPAVDLNDVVICPHDENLIAAGATDGAVYVWDVRSADRSQEPLHVLRHGHSENILANDREVELSDTGVRFLSWGATASRLFTGSSDGVVKTWNPCRPTDNAHVEDLAAPNQQLSAIMSGAFSPDYRELLIGTENGRIDLFSIGAGAIHRTGMRSFSLLRENIPLERRQERPFEAAQSLVNTGQIDIKPCGAMPFRQAVQGEQYKGPFLKPSASEAIHAERSYQQALDEQFETRSSKIDQKVSDAQNALEDIERREEHYRRCQSMAAEHQMLLANAEDERRDLEAKLKHVPEPCSLHCSVFRPSDHYADDSGRSELRIPSALRSVDQLALRVEDEESSNTCPSCSPRNALRAKAKGKKVTTCASCVLRKARLTSLCSRCNGPARMQTDKGPTMCERCSFSCFRCGKGCEYTVTFPNVHRISCLLCNLTWEAGVLGYELVSVAQRPRRQEELMIDDQQEEELATEEREHYASLWRDQEPESAY